MRVELVTSYKTSTDQVTQVFHYSSLFLLGKPCCSQTLGQEKYRSHENCVNGTKTGTYHNTQIIKSIPLENRSWQLECDSRP